jgi:hypothetical protein
LSSSSTYELYLSNSFGFSSFRLTILVTWKKIQKLCLQWRNLILQTRPSCLKDKIPSLQTRRSCK